MPGEEPVHGPLSPSVASSEEVACNAYAERFVRSIKEECLGRMIFFGEASLRRALREYEAHFNGKRPHQGIGNRVVEPRAEPRSAWSLGMSA